MSLRPRIQAGARPAYAALVVCLLAYVGSVIARQGGSQLPGLDLWSVSAFEIIVSAACIARAAVLRTGRAFPLVLGLAIMSWSVGDLVLAIESTGGGSPPTPSLADAFYLLFYPLTYVALMLMIKGQMRRFTVATWFDGAIAGLGAAAVCAAFVFGRVLHAAGGSGIAVATDLAYPICDVLLLAMVVGVTAVLPGRRRLPWMLLAAGFGVNAIGDTFNLFSSGIGASHVGSALNAIAWPTSILLISLSVWLPAATSHRRGPEQPPGFLLPGIAALGALAVLLVGSVHRIDTTAVSLAAATLAAAGVRFGLSLRSLRRLTAERHVQAVTDQLTTLGNRRALFELLDAVLEDEWQQPCKPVAFLFIDLNRFKEVNDAFGHSVGDELLRQLGARLKASLRETDVLVRLGGDEFVAVLLGADAPTGEAAAERITDALDEPFALGAVSATIAASIGIAMMPTDGTNAHDLLRCADLAMYRAKLRGERFAVYSSECDGQSNRLDLVHDLKAAIDARELELHYQPLVELRTGDIAGVEALVRWSHPELGNIPPLEFLPLAEDAGLMNPLTALVLDQAVRQCADWHAQGRPLTVSVNISATNLLDPGFPDSVVQALYRHGLPASALVLEITETTAMNDLDRCRTVIDALSASGVVVSVDDFGAGFTSLAYLSSLAVGELKLDRAFLTGLATAQDERDLALVRSTIELAHALGLRVVAEGIEDDASLNLLVRLDCDLAQGYLISKPKPAAQLTLERYASAPDGGPVALATAASPALMRARA